MRLPILLLAVILLSGRPASHSPAFRSGAAAPSSSTGFAVVELFTSEGCSSCPPADEALARLAGKYPDNVFVLAWHVDYWDRLGWKDIYSTADYTRRQQEYSRRFNLESVYTPEAVINGKKEFVGSDDNQLQATVKEELDATANSSLGLTTTSLSSHIIQVKFALTKAPTGATIQIALVQSKVSSQVLAGENQGMRLRHVNVVRDWQSTPASPAGQVSLKIPTGLTAKDYQVIAFLQNKDGHISAAEKIATPGF